MTMIAKINEKNERLQGCEPEQSYFINFIFYILSPLKHYISIKVKYSNLGLNRPKYDYAKL